jgi:hypothetical protein
MALSPASERGADQLVPAAVPSSTRLDCGAEAFVRRWKAPMLWKTGRQPGLSHVRARAGPGSASEPRGSTTGAPRGRPSQAAGRRSSAHGRADVGRRSAARPRAEDGDAVAQPEPWPVQLATDFGICGQIGRNPLDIQEDLATDRESGIVRNPCLDGVMRGSCPVPW